MKTDGKTKKYFKKGRKTGTTVKKSNKIVSVKQELQKMIKREIARDVENKISNNVFSTQSILTIVQQPGSPTPGPITYEYYVHNPYSDGLFQIGQGTGQNQRIGNQIKLKRWVIKGSLYYDPVYTPAEPFGQAQSYIDLYFGRLLDSSDQIDTALTDLFQQGTTEYTPTGQLNERLYSINKDLYKIYWHKRYKIGNASDSGNTINNNDYKINEEFGFDVCKKVCKNKVLKYSDNETDPSDSLVESLTLWAVCTSPNQNIALTPSSVEDPVTYYSPVRIQTISYIEYEDA